MSHLYVCDAYTQFFRRNEKIFETRSICKQTRANPTCGSTQPLSEHSLPFKAHHPVAKRTFHRILSKWLFYLRRIVNRIWKKNRVSYAIISMHVLVSSVVLALRDDAFIVCACVRCKRMLMHSRAGCHQPSSNNCKPRVTSSPNNVMPIFVVYSVHWYSATK